MSHRLISLFVVGAFAALVVTSARAAAPDGVVEWASLSHTGFTDRRPLCPLSGESFSVRFQAAHNDLTAARVGVDDGADGGPLIWVDAARQGTVGPYDVWSATLPATTATRVGYLFELVDGADRDYLTAAGVSDAQPTSGLWTLDYTTLSHAPLGATPTATGTVFRVWAPGASTCHVRGTFNGWSLANPLARQGEFFVGRVSNALPGHEYKYYFNNSIWKPDARARQIDNADNYNSVIVDPLAYAWRCPDFTPAPRDRWVVYQLHVGSFAGLNDPLGSFTRLAGYRDVGLRAGQLAELGVNAVMLNPINEFPGDRSGGYNPISMWAFESAYGAADDLKFMIDELHARGIAVILDVVWNHFATNDNYLWNYDGTQIYFDTPAVGTPWGSQADVDRAAVYDYFLDSVEHVLGEYRLDGYRQDAIYELVGATQAVSGQNLIRAMMNRVHTRFADSHVLGEIYNNSAWNTSPAGIHLDGQYHEAFKNAVRDAVAAAGFGDPDMGRLAAAIDGSGAYVEGDRVLNYFELHDDAWPLNGHQRAVRDIDTTAPYDDRYATGRTKLANGLTLLARGMPAILQGTEWLEDNGWEESKIDWSHKTTYADIFRFYQAVIALRTTEPALFANSPALVYHVNDGANVLAFERYQLGGDSFVVVANFSNSDFGSYLVGLPRPGRWGVILNSEDVLYRGRGAGTLPGCVVVEPIARDGLAQRTTLSLPAHGFLILKHEPTGLGCSPGDANCDDLVNFNDIDAFVTALVGESAYAAAYPGCDHRNADTNGDGAVNFDDIDAFVVCVIAGACP